MKGTLDDAPADGSGGGGEENGKVSQNPSGLTSSEDGFTTDQVSTFIGVSWFGKNILRSPGL